MPGPCKTVAVTGHCFEEFVSSYISDSHDCEYEGDRVFTMCNRHPDGIGTWNVGVTTQSASCSPPSDPQYCNKWNSCHVTRHGRALPPGKGWVGPRAGLDAEGRGKMVYPLSATEPWSSNPYSVTQCGTISKTWRCLLELFQLGWTSPKELHVTQTQLASAFVTYFAQTHKMSG
jgi:hypothetical protein